MSARRDAAHVLLDAVTALDVEKGHHDDNERAVNLALERLPLSEPAFREAMPIVGAALDLLATMIHALGERLEAEPAAVVAVIRAHMDTNVYHEPDGR